MVKSYSQIKDAPVPDQINRETQHIVIKNAFGDDFAVDVNDDRSVSQVKQEIGRKTGVPERNQLIIQNGEVMGDYESLKTGEVNLTYSLNGGAGFELIKKCPDMVAQKCLCYECGTKKMPDWENEDFAKTSCFCIQSTCGLNDCMKFQFCCFQINLNPFSTKIEGKFPDMIKIQLMIYKCGLQPLMDIMKENFIEGECFCLQEHCNLGEPMNWFQFFCLKFTL